MLPGIGGITAGLSSVRIASYIINEYKNSGLTTPNTTFSSVSLGAASTDRAIVCVAASLGGFAQRQISSATINGVSATILVQSISATLDSDDDLNIGMFAAFVPTGTSGDIVINYSSSGYEAVSLGVWSVQGMLTLTPVATGVNTTLSGLTLATAPGGFAIAACCNKSLRTTTWSGATEDYDDTGTLSSGARATTTGANITITPTLSGVSTYSAFVAATF